MLPLRREGALQWVISARGTTARYLTECLAERLAAPGHDLTVSVASRSDFDQFLKQQAGDALTDTAINRLARQWPHLSAGPDAGVGSWRVRIRNACITAALAGLMLLPTAFPAALIGGGLALWFMAFAVLRMAAAATPRAASGALPRLDDHELPLYTLIAALYHEASSVAPLLRALDTLDYRAKNSTSVWWWRPTIWKPAPPSRATAQHTA